MAKEKVKHMTGVFASAFAHAGHITKEEANKASNIADKVLQHEGNKMDKFLEHFAKEIDEYVAEFGEKFFM